MVFETLIYSPLKHPSRLEAREAFIVAYNLAKRHGSAFNWTPSTLGRQMWPSERVTLYSVNFCNGHEVVSENTYWMSRLIWKFLFTCVIELQRSVRKNKFQDKNIWGLKNIYCIYINTGCHRRNGPNFGRVFLMLNYTDITQNTYVQSW